MEQQNNVHGYLNQHDIMVCQDLTWKEEKDIYKCYYSKHHLVLLKANRGVKTQPIG